MSIDLKEYKLIDKIKGTTGANVWVYVTFVKKAPAVAGQVDEKKFKIGPGEGQEIGWFTIEEALALNLTPGTRITLSDYRDLIENMMKAA